MSQSGLSARDIVNTYSVDELTRILREYGEERFAYKIARNIEKRRAQAPIETTFELVEIVKESIPAPARREGGHPAKRTFQAIRIAVNSELDHLSQCLDRAFEYLAPGGRFAIITFHSLDAAWSSRSLQIWPRAVSARRISRFASAAVHRAPNWSAASPFSPRRRSWRKTTEATAPSCGYVNEYKQSESARPA